MSNRYIGKLGSALLIATVASGCASLSTRSITPLEARLKLGLPLHGQNLLGMGNDMLRVGDYFMKKGDYNELTLVHGKQLKGYMERNGTDETGVLKAMDENGDYVITSDEKIKFLKEYK